MKTNKLMKEFFNISFSETKPNCKYTNDELRSYLVAISLNNDSLESATGVSPDTIQRRLVLGDGYDVPWLRHCNGLMLDHIRYIVNRNKRVRWSLVLDESLEPYFGSFESLKTDVAENCLVDFLTNYKVQRGSTGSFHYVVMALHSKIGTFPIAVLPKVCNADYFLIYEAFFREVRRQTKNVCFLADRGFGNQEMISLCQKLKIDYCIRLKKAGKLKTIKKGGRQFFWHQFGEVKFRVVMHKSHGRETFFFAVGRKNGASQWFRLLYKNRWSIENLFKNGDRVQLRTNSRNPLFRLFCFALSMFLMLLYQFKKLVSPRTRLPIRRAIYDLFNIKILVVLRVT
jgi:hypothetical protein